MALAVRNVQIGKTIDYTNSSGSDIAYRQVIPITTRIAIAGEKIANGATGSVYVAEVWELPAVTGTAWSVGAQLYWDNTNGYLTTTSTSNTPAGWATEAKVSAAAVAKTKLG